MNIVVHNNVIMSCTMIGVRMLHSEYSLYMNIELLQPRTTQRRMECKQLSHDDCHTWSHPHAQQLTLSLIAVYVHMFHTTVLH